jgi:hypothetical protein
MKLSPWLLLLAVNASGQSSQPAVADFREITQSAGIQFQHLAPHTSHKYLLETMGSGVAIFDADNDGRMDLFFVNGAPFGDTVAKGTLPQKTGPESWNRYYHQKPDGSFEDLTAHAGLQGIGYGMGVAVGDYDNDGHEDLYVTGLGGNTLYHNNGDGTFTDVSGQAGVRGSGWSTSAGWADLDGDGFLDLIALRYIQWDWNDVVCGPPDNRGYCHPDVFPAISMLVYHNNGNGTFTEQSAKLGLANPAKALGISIADYDRDGHPDIFVANDSMVEFLFHNKGKGTFEEVGLDAGIAVDGDGRTFAGMGIDAADYNNDGLPDVVINDLANQKYALFRNSGDGNFSYESYTTGVAATSLLHSGWGMRFFDFDNDGWKDLIIAQGHDLDTVEKSYPNLHYREPPMLLRNVAGKKFVDAAAGEVFEKQWAGRGLAIGDIDNDGRVDVVISENGGPAHVLMNLTKTANHWIGFRLTGHSSNRDGIGAVIRVETAQGSQWATVSTASSYLSASDVRAHFGLGSDTAAKTVEIRWPSGIVQTLHNVAGDQYMKIDEPARTAGSGQ